MPDLMAQFSKDVPEDYVDTEAAWQVIAANGWVATPQLLFALVEFARQVSAKLAEGDS